jgi:hypothetical protein
MGSTMTVGVKVLLVKDPKEVMRETVVMKLYVHR